LATSGRDKAKKKWDIRCNTCFADRMASVIYLVVLAAPINQSKAIKKMD